MAKLEIVQVEPGIKKRSDGKYIVSLDFGRQYVEDKKTGEMKWKQVKTNKVVSSLKEARALRGANGKEKEHKKITGTTKKLSFKVAYEDYRQHKEKDWSDSYASQKRAHANRFFAYFGDKDIKSLSTMDIEEFFDWCREVHEGFPKPLENNTIAKIKSHLKDFFKFLKKNQAKYGITENIIIDAEVGKMKKFEATPLTETQLVELMKDVLKNEEDYSSFSIIFLCATASLRKGELCGLKWKDLDYENHLINVERARVSSSVHSWIEKLPKGEKKRKTVLCDATEKVLELVKKQQEELLGRPVEQDEYIYATKTNLINDYIVHPKKAGRRFDEMMNRINKIRRQAGKEEFPKIRLHDLRHTFITLCLNGKCSPFQVSAAAGHTIKGANTSIKVYWHDQTQRDDILNYFNNLLDFEIKAYQ